MVGKQFFVSATAVVLLDQIIKHFIQDFQKTIIPGLLAIQPVKNTGVVFGFMQGSNTAMTAVSIAVAAAIVTYRNRLNSKAEKLAGALILGGTIGNLADRAFRGGVLDYISIGSFPTFNLADASLTIGAVLIAATYIAQKYLKK